MKALFPTRRVQRVRHETRPRRGLQVVRREAAAMGRLRQVVLNEKGLPPETVRINAYWKKGDSGFHETLVNPVEQPPQRETTGARKLLAFAHQRVNTPPSQELTQTLYEIITDKLSSHGAS